MKKTALFLILLLLSGVLGGLSLASAYYAEEQITQAIDALREVRYDRETRGLLEAADAALAAADPDFHLERKIPNLQSLKEAKLEYVKLAIRDMYISIRDKAPEELIREKLQSAEEAFDTFLTEEDIPLLKNYSDLEADRAKYGPDAERQAQEPAAPQPAAAAVPELCPT